MREWEGEKYCNAKEAADLLDVSRPTFYKNVRKKLKEQLLPGRERKHYKLAEVATHRVVRQLQLSAS